jgi:hypothetical protein
MAIALEKILTTRQATYAATHLGVHAYEEVGVHHIQQYHSLDVDKALQDFAKKVPADALAVTDLLFSLSSAMTNGDNQYCIIQYSGTALIPSGKKREEGRRTEPM